MAINSNQSDRVKTTVVGHREAHYRGEPLSSREIHRLDEPVPLRIVKPENGPGVSALIEQLRNLASDDLRKAVISEFCKSCGSTDTSCQCWNDE